MTNFDLSGSVAWITGASRGIGKSIAETYAKAGAKVIISSRKQEGLDSVAKIINDNGGEALPIAAHSGEFDAINKVVNQASESFGGIDIVVNNAGTNPHFGQILTAEESHWKKILDVNLVGYFRVVKACVEKLKERGGGKIINIASIAGLKPAPAMGVYSVSKAGVIMLTKVLALELAQENIQVNAIAPGFVKTKFSSAVWGNDMIYDLLKKETPQKRLAKPEEINGLALYLASAESNFVTGSVFVVDGGLMIGSFMELYS